MKITYLPNDFDAPGCYRCMFPGRQLAAHGHTVQLPPWKFLNDNQIEMEVKLVPPTPHADLWVLQQRKERDWGESGVQTLRMAGVAVIADVDDNYLETPPTNPAFYGLHPYRRDDGVILSRKARRRAAKTWGSPIPPNKFNRNHLHRILECADAVTVSTPYLANLYERFNKSIYVVRNYLDWDIWKDVQPQYEVERDRPRIGYLGVFKYRSHDLDLIKRVIPRFLKDHPEVEFVANTHQVHDYLGVPEDQRVTIGEYDFYPRDGGPYPVGNKTAVMDIGLIPLSPGGFNEGKSHLKGMEYNAAGIPFIASPTESYKDYWCDGTNGFLAHNEKEWREHLEELVWADSQRRLMGRNGRLKASKHTIQRNWDRWEHVYQQVLGYEEEKIARIAIKIGAIQKVSELATLLRMVKLRKPQTIVEIGSAAGGTFWALAQVAADDALLVSIDIPAGSPIDQRGGKDVYHNRNRDNFPKFVKPTQRCVTIDANSQETDTLNRLIDTLGIRKIDLLFIDGDHRYEGVKRDFELYRPLVATGGLIVFHDISKQNDSRAQVGKLWRELPGNKQEIVGHDSWGLGNWGGIGVLNA